MTARNLIDCLIDLVDDESGIDVDPDPDIADVWLLNRRRR